MCCVFDRFLVSAVHFSQRHLRVCRLSQRAILRPVSENNAEIVRAQSIDEIRPFGLYFIIF